MVSSLLQVENEVAPGEPMPSAPLQAALPRMALIPIVEDRVFLRGLRTEALVGVYEHERIVPQPLVIDLEIGLANFRSCFSDDLADAVDYEKVAETIHGIAGESRTQLLEALAQRIASAVLANFDAKWVQVDIVKPAIIPEAEVVGVSIKRARSYSRREAR
ncbi:MAG TPA: dihydroneopterin aldolase [Noviherbaspirillum sp.]|uniref:dihydroneopterin aldolase n=1 Tax=Noviherbaspirillum sp. TaxID=1926288 RepID=UPI002B461DE9|nr:dihydroneopterin aldolase [Noviherbaspirillum sp.]HJV88203.1 dihydroneopterin aldolase [Noviherbaspirillum sp.]